MMIKMCRLTLQNYVPRIALSDYPSLPFSISSAPEVFQRRMFKILNGIEKAVCMMDDVLVLGKDKEGLNKWLEVVLSRLSESKITLNQEKYEFAQLEVKFLRQIIDQNGVRSDPLKVKAITDIPPPTNLTEARHFLGKTSQLSKFCPQLLAIAKPIRVFDNK